MRYMIIIKATRTRKPAHQRPRMFDKMGRYHQQLAEAGVLLDASGLQPSNKGWRVEFRGEHRTVVDGPFVETKEIIAGFTIIHVKWEAEAREWPQDFRIPTSKAASRKSKYAAYSSSMTSRRIRRSRYSAGWPATENQQPVTP